MTNWEHKSNSWATHIEAPRKKWACCKPRITFTGGTHCSYCGKLNPNLTEEPLEFDDWLNEQCIGGWEVIKISRNYRSQISNIPQSVPLLADVRYSSDSTPE
jgi:hypothetical protein